MPSIHHVKAKSLRANDVVMLDGLLQQVYKVTPIPEERLVSCMVQPISGPLSKPVVQYLHETINVNIHML